MQKVRIKRVSLKEADGDERGLKITQPTQVTQQISFEEDPINYLLIKYPSLRDTLNILMSNAFKDYLNGIYVVAPRPTTFKIVLHNNQEFFLIWTGKTYICKVEGKKYYLTFLSDKQRATNAIAQLLELGNPIGKPGPSDQEENQPQGPEEEETATEEEGGGEPGGESEEETLEESVKSKKKVRIIKEAFTVFPTSTKDINNPEIQKLYKVISQASQTKDPISLDPDKQNIVNVSRKFEQDKKVLAAIKGLTGKVLSKTIPIKWGKISIKFGEGSKGGRGAKSKGLGFEGALASDLDEYNVNGFSNEKNFTHLKLVQQIVKDLKLKPGNFTVLPEGEKNQSRPLIMTSKGPEISFSQGSAAATLTDITIEMNSGEKHYLSCKFGATLTFFNSGITKILPSAEINKGDIKNPTGKKLLDTFGINSKAFCKVFQEIGDKTDYSKYSGPAKSYDESAIKNLLKSGIGTGYYMAWSTGTDYEFYKIDEKYVKKASEIQGSINVLYGGSGGTGERVDVTFESPYYFFKVNIRNKQGGQYPTHIMCDYKKKR